MWQWSAQLLTPPLQIFPFSATVGEPQEWNLFQLLVRHRNGKTVAEFAQRLQAHLFLLMGNHLTFAGLAHAISLHRFGKDHGRLTEMFERGCVSGVYFDRVVTAAPERPNVIIAPVLHQRGGLGILSEELLAHIGAVLRFEILVFAVDTFLHAFAQQARSILGKQLIPARSPQHLDDIPAGATKHPFELLDDLAVVETLPPGERHRAQRHRFVHFAVAHEGPHLSGRGVGDAAPMQVFEEPRLVDRHQWAKPHRHGGELPEVRHQTWMWIG